MAELELMHKIRPPLPPRVQPTHGALPRSIRRVMHGKHACTYTNKVVRSHGLSAAV